MKKLKKYPLTLLCVALIFVLCLMPVPEVELGNVPAIDKWTHVVMYLGTCSVLWWEYARSHSRPRPLKMLLWGVVAPVILSGVIELLQAAVGYRSGDWVDFAANTIGVLLAYGGMKVVWRRR